MTEDCPDCGAELEDAEPDDPDNDFFCISCGGLFSEQDLEQDDEEETCIACGDGADSAEELENILNEKSEADN